MKLETYRKMTMKEIENLLDETWWELFKKVEETQVPVGSRIDDQICEKHKEIIVLLAKLCFYRLLAIFSNRAVGDTIQVSNKIGEIELTNIKYDTWDDIRFVLRDYRAVYFGKGRNNGEKKFTIRMPKNGSYITDDFVEWKWTKEPYECRTKSVVKLEYKCDNSYGIYGIMLDSGLWETDEEWFNFFTESIKLFASRYSINEILANQFPDGLLLSIEQGGSVSTERTNDKFRDRYALIYYQEKIIVLRY